jgi:hypothetical protein
MGNSFILKVVWIAGVSSLISWAGNTVGVLEAADL